MGERSLSGVPECLSPSRVEHKREGGAYPSLKRRGLRAAEGEDSKVRAPRTNRLGVLLRHHLDDLAEMVEVVHHPVG